MMAASARRASARPAPRAHIHIHADGAPPPARHAAGLHAARARLAAAGSWQAAAAAAVRWVLPAAAWRLQLPQLLLLPPAAALRLSPALRLEYAGPPPGAARAAQGSVPQRPPKKPLSVGAWQAPAPAPARPPQEAHRAAHAHAAAAPDGCQAPLSAPGGHGLQALTRGSRWPPARRPQHLCLQHAWWLVLRALQQPVPRARRDEGQRRAGGRAGGPRKLKGLAPPRLLQSSAAALSNGQRQQQPHLCQGLWHLVAHQLAVVAVH